MERGRGGARGWVERGRGAGPGREGGRGRTRSGRRGAGAGPEREGGRGGARGGWSKTGEGGVGAGAERKGREGQGRGLGWWEWGQILGDDVAWVQLAWSLGGQILGGRSWDLGRSRGWVGAKHNGPRTVEGNERRESGSDSSVLGDQSVISSGPALQGTRDPGCSTNVISAMCPKVDQQKTD